MRASEEYSIINSFTQSPPTDIQTLIKALGIQYHEAYLNDDISGMLEKQPSGKFRITVNATHPETRKRFTAAHELGHYMRHRSLVGDGVDDNKAYRSTEGGEYHNINIGPKQETEANRFAALVLMHGPTVEREFKKNDSYIELAKLFGVSEQAMAWRLVNLGLASKERVSLR